MNHLSHTLRLKSLENDGTFSGYASVFNYVDLQQESIEKGAFTQSLKNWQDLDQFPKMLWQHDPKAPIGRWLEIREDAYGLFVKGQLLLDVQQGREAYTFLKEGVIDGLSIGFQILKARRGNTGRTIQEIDLHEISLVTFAASPKAKITSLKDWMISGDVIGKLVQRLSDLQGIINLHDLLGYC